MSRTATRHDLDSYQRSVERLWQSTFLNYPKHVSIETLTLCPAACTFCPYPRLERKGNRMSDALIDKIIADLGDIPDTVPVQLSPFKVSDPFVDKRIFDILRKVNRELPSAVPTLTTSAVTLTSRVLEELAAVERVGYLWISLNDHRPAYYTQTMSLPWDRTLEAVTRVHEAKTSGALGCRVVVSRVADQSEVDEQFCAWVNDRFPAFEVWLFDRADWIGQVEEDTAAVPPVGCRHWFELSITSTGVVALCCMDGNAEWAIGDVSNEHLLDVYNRPSYRNLRLRARNRLDVAPCNRCTLL